MKKIIIVTSILLILTGCYDRTELNDLAIVSGIDISKNKNNYNITMQIINTSKNNKENQNYKIYEGTGKSINDAINNIINKAPKKLYESQIQILILDENTAKENLKEVLDYFIRNNETRDEFFVLISKNNKTNTPIIKTHYSQDIINTLKSNKKNSGIVSLTTLNELIKKYQNKKVEITLPIIEQTNNNQEINITSTAIFKNNKLIGNINEKESIILNIITNNIENTSITIQDKASKYITTQLIKPKTKIYIKNNKINIKITGTALIRENNYKLNLEDKDNINIIQKKLNKNINQEIKKTIKKINKKYNTDIYELKDIIYKHNNKYYKKYIEKNNNYLNNIDISINSKIKLINDNNILGGTNNE